MVQSAGWSATTLHSDKTQTQREAALQSLRDGEVQALVATDVAGRGLDVPDVCKYCLQLSPPRIIVTANLHSSFPTAPLFFSRIVALLLHPFPSLSVLRDINLPRVSNQLGYFLRQLTVPSPHYIRYSLFFQIFIRNILLVRR
jgi:reverse gyrase